MLTLGTATLNRYDLLAEMIASAEAGTRPPDQYFLIDNGGKSDGILLPENFTRSILDCNRKHFRAYNPGRNLGVGPSVNMVFQNNDDLTIWTNDDVRFEPDTLELLEKAALEDPERLFILPEAAVGSAFTVFLARKKLFERVGWFDERFVPAYFEDNDFGYRMNLAGIQRHVVPCSYFHHTSATLEAFSLRERIEHDKNFVHNQELYIAKWGGLPEKERYREPQA